MPAKSKSQQRLFGMLHAYNKGELKGSKSLMKRLSSMSRHISDEDATHFAQTPHKGLPEKKAFDYRTFALGKLAEETVETPQIGKNNNPGNLRYYGVGWFGEQPKGLQKGQFTRFKTPQLGLRAAARNLMTLGRRAGKGKFTIGNVIPKYSPPSENNTERHMKTISSISGLGKDTVLDERNLGQMVDLLRGVVGAESGQDVMRQFTPFDFTNGVRRAWQNMKVNR